MTQIISKKTEDRSRKLKVWRLHFFWLRSPDFGLFNFAPLTRCIFITIINGVIETFNSRIFYNENRSLSLSTNNVELKIYYHGF